MRIAVSGTHCSGKSTLVEAFVCTHADFVHEPEPYTTLVEAYGEEFSARPTVEDFFRQLEFNCERLREHSSNGNVILERCPADFLAYILALQDLRRAGDCSNLLETACSLVATALRQLDLIVYLPLDDIDVEVAEEEDPRLRVAMDACLSAILLNDSLDLLAPSDTKVIELYGTTAERLRLIESAIGSL